MLGMNRYGESNVLINSEFSTKLLIRKKVKLIKTLKALLGSKKSLHVLFPVGGKKRLKFPSPSLIPKSRLK